MCLAQGPKYWHLRLCLVPCPRNKALALEKDPAKCLAQGPKYWQMRLSLVPFAYGSKQPVSTVFGVQCSNANANARFWTDPWLNPTSRFSNLFVQGNAMRRGGTVVRAPISPPPGTSLPFLYSNRPWIEVVSIIYIYIHVHVHVPPARPPILYNRLRLRGGGGEGRTRGRAISGKGGLFSSYVGPISGEFLQRMLKKGQRCWNSGWIPEKLKKRGLKCASDPRLPAAACSSQ
jgi:hypothetical protein